MSEHSDDQDRGKGEQQYGSYDAREGLAFNERVIDCPSTFTYFDLNALFSFPCINSFILGLRPFAIKVFPSFAFLLESVVDDIKELLSGLRIVNIFSYVSSKIN